MDFNKIPIHDEDILNIIRLIRQGNHKCELLDKLIQLLGDRKLMVKYYTNTYDAKYIFITKKTIWRLCSFFIHEGDEHNQMFSTADYLNDIFVQNIYKIELYEIK